MKKVVMIIISLFLVISSSFSYNTFTDVESSAWYFEWINDLVNENITSGYPDGTFKPDNQLKRIELLSFTMKALGHDLPLAEGYWGQNIIDKALELKIIDEGDDIVKNPDGMITRQETAYIIYNAYKLNNDKFDDDTEQQVKLLVEDIDDVDDKYLEGVIGVFAEGIVSGYDDKSFKPNNSLTRAEAAVFISRLKLSNKRVEVTLNLPYFEYNFEGNRTEKFKLYYDPKYQDLYNILTIGNTIENEDVNNGFAWISTKGYDPDIDSEGHEMKLYSNKHDYEYAPVEYHSDYMRYNIRLNYKKDSSGYYDYINIFSWRREGDFDHELSIKFIYEYLFDDDADLVWSKFLEATNSTEKWVWESSLNNGRYVRVGSDHIGVGVHTSLIEFAPKIDINNFTK